MERYLGLSKWVQDNQCNHKGLKMSEREAEESMSESEKEIRGRKQRDSLELLALRMEERATGQGVRAAPGAEKGEGADSPLDSPGGTLAGPHRDFSPGGPTLNSLPVELRDYTFALF